MVNFILHESASEMRAAKQRAVQMVGRKAGHAVIGMARLRAMPAVMAVAVIMALLTAMLGGCSQATRNSSDGSAAATDDAKAGGDAASIADDAKAGKDAAPIADDAKAGGDAAPIAGSAPAGEPSANPITIRIGGLKGATSMGMVKLLDDAQGGKAFNTYEFTLAGAADELTPKLMNGELDIAAIPANLASVLYNNTGGKIRLLAINTLGVLYIVEDGDTVKSLADLNGKSIYATGRGAVPEYALNYLLKMSGVSTGGGGNGNDNGNDNGSGNGNDNGSDGGGGGGGDTADGDKSGDGGSTHSDGVKIEWKAEPTEVVSLMAKNKGSIAMMPQPYVTVAQGVIENLRIAVDLAKEWDALGDSGKMLTGVLVVRADFASGHPDQIAKFMEEYKASTEYVNANIAEASLLIEKFDIVKAAVAEKALPYCNIVFYAGQDMRSAMQGYLRVLYDQNPKSIGGVMPDEGFYYGA